MATAESINARLAATLAPYEAQLASAKQQYETQQKLLGDQLAARQQQVQARYDTENQRFQQENQLLSQRLTDQNNRALQDAYIKAQQASKALPQQLAAQGMHGGMTETSMVRLNNNYQNNRNALDRDFQTNLSDLNRSYQNSLADLRLNYDQNMGDLDLTYQEKLAALGNDYFSREQDINARIAAAKAQAQAELAELAAAQLARRYYGDNDPKDTPTSSPGYVMTGSEIEVTRPDITSLRSGVTDYSNPTQSQINKAMQTLNTIRNLKAYK